MRGWKPWKEHRTSDFPDLWYRVVCLTSRAKFKTMRWLVLNYARSYPFPWVSWPPSLQHDYMMEPVPEPTDTATLKMEAASSFECLYFSTRLYTSHSIYLNLNIYNVLCTVLFQWIYTVRDAWTEFRTIEMYGLKTENVAYTMQHAMVILREFQNPRNCSHTHTHTMRPRGRNVIKGDIR